MNTVNATNLDAVGHCPYCGYDQRGLPAGSPCPECGQVYWPGESVGEINRWADRLLLNLWSIAVLLIVSIVSGLTSFAAASSASASLLMMMISTAYIVAADAWYLLSIASFVARRFRPTFADLPIRKQASLGRWLVLNGALVAASILLVLLMLG